jgi:vesicular inhibitory amino acid transporter
MYVFLLVGRFAHHSQVQHSMLRPDLLALRVGTVRIAVAGAPMTQHSSAIPLFSLFGSSHCAAVSHIRHSAFGLILLKSPTPPSKMPFYTLEDAKTSFSLFCGMYGIGTLGMPGNFSRSGPVIAVIAMAFMAFANIYASVKMSQVMLLAPKSVKTFGDLGEWSMGKTGRWLSVVSQMASCLLIPCVFLVLGGSLLDGLFPDAFSATVWIILMALMVLPVCLIPTLKEGAGAAFAGCLGTIIADVIGVAVVMYGMRGHPSVPSPDLKISQVLGCFGNLALAYGAGIVIPDLQRQHSDPTRMPRIVLVTVSFISCMFLVLASTAYSAVGCQISGNLLFTIYPDADTGMTALGFKPSWGAVVLAYLFMQLHITVAFSVLINPAFYIAERLALGMHKKVTPDMEAGLSYAESATPGIVQTESRRSSKMSYVSAVDNEGEFKDDIEAEAAEYRGGMNTIKYVVLRVVIVVILVVLSIIFQDHFSDFSDFIGASCITTNCILLPIIFYLLKAWRSVPVYEKTAGIIVVVVCTVLGCYVTYTTGKSLFTPTDDDTDFPYCDSEYENQVYYNYTAEHDS